MGKTISDALFWDLVRYHIYDVKDDPALEARIVTALEEKIEAMVKRQTYAEKQSLITKNTRP